MSKQWKANILFWQLHNSSFRVRADVRSESETRDPPDWAALPGGWGQGHGVGHPHHRVRHQDPAQSRRDQRGDAGGPQNFRGLGEQGQLDQQEDGVHPPGQRHAGRDLRAQGGGDGAQGHCDQQDDERLQRPAQQEHAADAPSQDGEWGQ